MNFVNRSRHLKGDITVFAPIGHGRRVTSVFSEKAGLCSEHDLQGLGIMRELHYLALVPDIGMTSLLFYGTVEKIGNCFLVICCHTSP